MTDNIYDQFDHLEQPSAASQGNIYDQFDHLEQSPAASLPGQQEEAAIPTTRSMGYEPVDIVTDSLAARIPRPGNNWTSGPSAAHRRNLERYEQAGGDPVEVLGFDTGLRTVQDEAGHRHFVPLPPAGSIGGDLPFVDAPLRSPRNVLLGSAANIVEGVGTLAGDYLDDQMRRLSGEDDLPQIGDEIRRVVPDMNTETFLERFAMEALPMALGGGIAVKGAQKATSGLQFFQNTLTRSLDPSLSRKVASHLLRIEVPAAAGAVAAIDPSKVDSILDSLREGEGSAGRLQLFVEGVAVGAGVQAAGKGLGMILGMAGRLAENAVGLTFSKKTQLRRATEDMVRIVSRLPDDATPEQRRQALDELVEIVESEKQLFRDGLAAVGTVLKIDRDTARAIMEGAGDLGPDAALDPTSLRQGAAEFRRTVSDQPGFDLIKSRHNAQQGQIYDFFEQTEQAFGGPDQARRAGQEFGRLGASRLDDAGARVMQAEIALKEAEEQAIKEIRADQSVMARVQAQRIRHGILDRGPEREGTERLTRDLGTLLGTMNKKLDKLAADIPDGLPFDVKHFAKTLEGVAEQANDWDTSVQEAFKSVFMRNMRRTVQPKFLQEEDRFENWVEIANRLMLEGGLDFKTLYTKTAPQLSELVDELYRSGAPGSTEAAKNIAALRDSIRQHQVDWLARNNELPGAEKAQKFLQYYKANYAPIWRDLRSMEQFSRLYTDTMGRYGQKQQKPMRFQDEGFGLVGSLFEPGGSSARREFVRQANDAPGGRKLKIGETAAQIVMSRAARELDAMTRADNAPTAGQLTAALREHMDLIGQYLPDKRKAATGLLRRLENAERTTQAAAQDLAQARSYLLEVERDVYKGALGRFLTQKGFAKDTADMGPAFRRLFTGDDAVTNVRELIKTAENEGNTEAVQGLRAAFLEDTLQRLQNTRKQGWRNDGSTLPEGSEARAAQMTRAWTDSTLELADMLFEPEVAGALRWAVREQQELTGSTALRSQTRSSETNMSQQMRAAWDQMVTLGIGVLSREATIARNLGASLRRTLRPEERYQFFMEALLADPDFFVRSVNDLIGAADENRRVQIATKWIVRSLPFAGGENEAPTDDLEAARP